MAITSIDIIRGFDFDKVESRISLSMFLEGMWDKLSAEYEIVEILWDGFNEFITPHRDYLAALGLPSDEMKIRIDAVAPEIDEISATQGIKWNVPESVLRTTADGVMNVLLKSYRMKGINA
jgi:hypothetical protein